ncbi:MAG: hypothetical protein ACREHC_01890 [Candidatus Levyibacteriota bacterium]
MSKNASYILILLLLVVFLCLLFLSQKQKQNPPLQSTVTPTQSQTPLAVNGNAQCHARFINPSDPQAALPDPNCTPGAVNPDVNESDLDQTICHPGYSQTIRPPSSYTNKLKKAQIAAYGYTDGSTKKYEEDHFISLELGGSPTDPKNLWPEPHGSPNEKDKVENYLHKEICNRTITLQEAQQEITTNWYTIYQSIQ